MTEEHKDLIAKGRLVTTLAREAGAEEESEVIHRLTNALVDALGVRDYAIHTMNDGTYVNDADILAEIRRILNQCGGTPKNLDKFFDKTKTEMDKLRELAQ